jgi:hypothetical protein
LGVGNVSIPEPYRVSFRFRTGGFETGELPSGVGLGGATDADLREIIQQHSVRADPSAGSSALSDDSPSEASMSDGTIRSISWHLDEDGGGDAIVSVDHKSHVDDKKYVFESLDELPPGIVKAIREDGRAKGKIPDDLE